PRPPPCPPPFPYPTLFRSNATLAPILPSLAQRSVASRRGAGEAARTTGTPARIARGTSASKTASGVPCASSRVEAPRTPAALGRSEEHTSELQSQSNLVCR